MADKKISQLTTLVQANVDVTADFVPIVDTGAVETKKVTPQALVQAGATGATLALADGAAATPSLTNTGDENTGIFFPAADTIAASTGGAERMRLDSSGNLGIGTSSPQAKLEVAADTNATVSVRVSQSNLGTSAIASLRLDTQGNSWSIRSGRDGGYLSFHDAGGERARFDNSGNLGIGTSSPSRKIEVHGAPSTVGGAGTGVLASFVNNTTAFNASPTSAISLWNRFNSAGSIFPSAVLQAGKENATDGNYAGYMSFLTVDSAGGVNERARITAAGNIVAGGSVALATTATDGFLYVPTCAGTPTGTPTAITGMAPIVVNTTNNKLYFYSGGAWRDAGP